MRYLCCGLVFMFLYACGDEAKTPLLQSSNTSQLSDLDFILNDIKEIQERSGPPPVMKEEDLAKAAADAAPLLDEMSSQDKSRSNIEVPVQESAVLVDTRNSLWYYRQLRNYEKTYPDATQEELEAYVDDILNNQPAPEKEILGQTAGTSTQALDFIDGPLYTLNPAEQAIYSQNTVIGIKMLAAGWTALQMSKAYWTTGLEDGNGDAFRHCLWNVYMCSIANCTWAQKWGDAHEAYWSYGLPRTMDLNNNQVGRNLFAYYGSYATYAVPTATWQGYLIRIVGNRLYPTNRDGYRY